MPKTPAGVRLPRRPRARGRTINRLRRVTDSSPRKTGSAHLRTGNVHPRTGSSLLPHRKADRKAAPADNRVAANARPAAVRGDQAGKAVPGKVRPDKTAHKGVPAEARNNVVPVVAVEPAEIRCAAQAVADNAAREAGNAADLEAADNAAPAANAAVDLANLHPPRHRETHGAALTPVL